MITLSGGLLDKGQLLVLASKLGPNVASYLEDSVDTINCCTTIIKSTMMFLARSVEIEQTLLGNIFT